MHLLRPTHQTGQGSRAEGGAARKGRGGESRLRAVLSDLCAHLRGPERSRQPSGQDGQERSRLSSPRGSRDPSLDHLSAPVEIMQPSKNPWADIPKINHDLLAPLENTPWTYFLLVGGLSVVVTTGAGAWIYQIETGIGQTNLHPPIFWAAYIASFVYWIGVSHSG